MDNTILERLFSFLETAPNDSFTLYSIAYEYKKLQNYKEARQYFSRLKENDPAYVGLYYHLGGVLEQLDQPEAAMQV